jgi:hypothetical protein
LFFILIAGLASGFFISQRHCKPLGCVDGELCEPPAKAFITPLGVIPLQNGKRVQADLRDGFVMTASQDPRYQTRFVVSLSADEIQPLLQRLLPEIFPDQAYAILTHDRMGPKGETRQQYLTPFVNRDQILPKLDPYMFRLVHDGTVGFGVGWYSRTRHEEVFVNSKKIMTIMTSKPDVVEEILVAHNIDEFEVPRFITDYETANGDLRSFADVYPEDYAQFRSNEFLSSAYLPELIQQLGFKKN